MIWDTEQSPYGELGVSQAGSRSKFKGLKSYEAYNITGGGGPVVERRHKHFVWLHDRLTQKYSLICVPPLPDKQFLGKYGENFLDKREYKLRAWLNRSVRPFKQKEGKKYVAASGAWLATRGSSHTWLSFSP